MKDIDVPVKCLKCGAVIREQTVPGAIAAQLLAIFPVIKMRDICPSCAPKVPDGA